ncbi:uncharacterized protein LOC110185428 [Drosophila serrata]|uniref:uncharacterized protein LOC110185428 n=1 Tax=Drosophila serrata TaxID=7274 RepID=UPI000A1D2872|nr:uncharacterized protein LOC110185428 [Drosophila serrata]
MNHLKYLLIGISLLLGAGNVWCDCQLSKANTWSDRTFAHIVSNRYELLLTDRLQTNQNLHLLCGGGQVVFSTTCQSNGHLNPPLPTTNCTVPLTPTVQAVRDPSCSHTMYRVGFPYQQQFLEIYRSCYQASTMTAYFSITKVYPTYLNSDGPPPTFDRDGLISPADVATFQRKSIYNQFERILGRHQRYIPNDKSSSFERGHLSPAGDHTFTRNLRQTNKYLNVMAQHQNINRSNWKIVENWVHRLFAVRQFDVLKVCTGTLGVLELDNTAGHPVQIFLATNKNPAPKWMYKIVSHLSGYKVVVLTYNNGWATVSPDPTSVCQRVSCPSSLTPNGTGFTFCCDPVHFISSNVPNLTGVC